MRSQKTSMERRELDLIVGAHSVEAMLQFAPESILEVIVQSPGTREGRGIADLARRQGIAVRVMEAMAFRNLVRGRAFQGVAARVTSYRYTDEADLLCQVTTDGPGLVVALDSVQDPQNLGSVLRTSAFFGVRGVILPKDRAVPVTPAVVRASAGTAVRIPVARVTNLSRTLRAWREAGVRVVGAVVSGGEDVSNLRGTQPTVLVLGSEHEGLRRLVRESCDALVSLRSPKGVESLNVGVAAGILIYEWVRTVLGVTDASPRGGP